jgi:secreted trypsin-like serine protease
MFIYFKFFYFLTDSILKPETRIVGGIVVPEDSVFFKFTVQVIIYYRNGSQFCGGSIISPNYIITAGHYIGYPMSNHCNFYI